MAEAGRRDFFVSYHPADRAWAEWAAWQLEQRGYETIVQDWDLKPGENIIERKNEALRTCHYTLAVVTPAYLASPVSRDEWTAAFLNDSTSEGRLLCLRVVDCPLPPLLRSRVSIDIASLDERDATAALMRGLAPRRAGPTAAPPFPRAEPAAGETPRFPGVLPQIFKVPPRNPNFTGRLELLHALETTLQNSTTVVQAALHGLGGIGKTQIAIEYAHRYAISYDIVWWVNAEQPAVLQADLAALARTLGIDGVQDQIDLLFARLRQKKRWLIIFDNADEPGALYGSMPSGGHILITSRNPNWGNIATRLTVDVLTPLEAETFLTKCIQYDDRVGIAELAARLDNLPLALEQAAAYVDAAQITVADYLELLGSSAVHAFPATPPLGYSQTVASTWQLTLNTIRKESPDGYTLLTFCAFLAPDGIPRRLLLSSAAGLPDWLASAVAAAPRYHAAVQALRKYSMIKASAEEISLHRLVQWVVRRRAQGSQPQPKQVVEGVVSWLLHVFPVDSGEPQRSPACERLLPHVLAAKDFAAEYGVINADLAVLLDRAAVFLHAKTRLTDARNLFETACGIWEELRLPALRVLRTRLGFARLLQDLGSTRQAQELFDSVEQQLRSRACSDPSLLVTALIDIGRLHQEDGALRDARKRIGEALELCRGTEIPVEVLAKAHGILGRIEQDLGNISQAKHEYQLALARSREAFGDSDSRVALRRNNLAGALHLNGELTEARRQLTAALAVLESVYSQEHDRTVAVRINLGAALHLLGQYEAARGHYELADRICDRLGFARDPRIAMIRTGLGTLLHDMADLAAAVDQHRNALTMAAALHESGHPRMVVIQANAGAALERVSELKDSRTLLESALAGAGNLYGASHPRVAAIRSIWGIVLGRCGERDAAWAEELRSLRDTVRVYGETHNRVSVIENNLGNLAHAAGACEEALAHFHRATRIAERSYGPDHPRTALIRTNTDRCKQGTTTGAAPEPLFIPLHIHQQASTIDR